MTNKAIIILSLLFIPIITASTNPYSFNLYTFDEVGNGSSMTGNLTNFTELLDTPSSYTGSSGDCVAVNIGETGLEFVSCGTGGGGLINTFGDYLYDNTTTIFFNDTFNNETIISIGNSLYYPLTGNPSNFINSTQVTNISINNGLSTGILEGGILGITPGNNTLFNITDGFGYIVNNSIPEQPVFHKVEWSGLTNLTPTYLNTNLISFIGIDPDGNVIQQPNRWTNEEARRCILLGVLVHVNLQNLDTVNQEQNIAPNPSAQVRDVLEGLGFVNVNGNVFSANGNNLNIDKSVGVMMGSGINYYVNNLNPHHLTLDSLTNLSFQYRYQNGSNDINGPEPMGWYKDVDPNNYDLNSVLTAVPNNKFTIQRIYSFTSNNVKLQRGQNIYSTLEDAKAGIGTDNFVTEPSIVANGMLRGFLILKQGTTDLTDTSEAIFIKAGKLGEETPSSGGGGGGGTTNLTNYALNNQSNNFIGNQTFEDNITAQTVFGEMGDFRDANGNGWELTAENTGAGGLIAMLNAFSFNGAVKIGAVKTGLFITPEEGTTNSYLSLLNRSNDQRYDLQGDFVNNIVRLYANVGTIEEIKLEANLINTTGNINGEQNITSNEYFLGDGSLLSNLFLGKTTDDLTEGTINHYNNDSFNQTLTDTLYYSEGDNITSSNLNVTGTLDVQDLSTFNADVIFNEEVDGTKWTLTLGDSRATSITPGSSRALRGGHNGIDTSTNIGWVMPCDGSVTDLTYSVEIVTGLVGFNLCQEILNNGALIYNTCVSTTGFQSATRNQARNTDIFSQGDIISGRQRNIGTQAVTPDNSLVTVRGYCDD